LCCGRKGNFIRLCVFEKKYVLLQKIIMDTTLLHKIQSTFTHAPVLRAWLFGSFARQQESANSDIDILVQFVPNAKITLLDYGGIVYELEQTTGRKVDLVQDTMLKPFARKTVEHDKILIYERTTEITLFQIPEGYVTGEEFARQVKARLKQRYKTITP
jgi:predicted nucleotidyltransferase